MRSFVLAAGLCACALAAPAAAPVPRPHPRVEVDAPLLQQLRALREANDPLWTRFYRSATSGAARADLLSTMLAFLVTGEKPLYDRAWQTVRGKIYRNKTDRSGGLMPILDLYKDAHDAAYMGGVFLGAVAHFYDWGYRQLSPDERRDVIAWLHDAAEFAHVKNPEGRLYMRNDGASVTQGVAAAAYATIGDAPEGDRMMAWFRERWGQTVKGLDIMGKGGATGEGNAYGTAPTASGIVTSANIAYYAAGEDLFQAHPFFRQRLLYDAFAAYPDTLGGPAGTIRYPDIPFVEQASIAGDGRRAISWHARNLRRNGLTLSRRFAGSEEAAVWNWVYRQPAVDQAPEDAESVFDLLYYSPRPRLAKPKRLSFYDPSMGFVYIRSDWDSPDATWISFWAGPHIDTHQHLDQGAFTVFKRRDLAPKTGHYDSGVYSPHHISWYLRTISSNALLIGDPSEIFRGYISGMGCDENGNVLRVKSEAKWPGCIPNDGGQRTMSPHSLAAPDAAFFEQHRDVFDVARVLSFRDDGRAVTVAADITNAYNNPRHTTPGNKPKVNRVWRRLVYLRPVDLLLVADVVESMNPAFEKKWLLHALDRIELGGKVEKVDEGESVHRGVDTATVVVDDSRPSDRDQTTFDLRRGYAALMVKTVFPAAFRYRRIGGREPSAQPHPDLYNSGRNKGHYHRHIKDFWIKDYSEGVVPNHKSFNWAPERPTEISLDQYIPVYGPGYGRWRLEVEPEKPATTDFFLNVLKPTLDKGETLPPVRRIETGNTFGAEIYKDGARYIVTFDKDDASRLEVRVTQ